MALWLPGMSILFLFGIASLVLKQKSRFRPKLSDSIVAVIAYTVFCAAITVARQHLFEASHLLSMSLVALAAVSFLVASYVERFQVVAQASGLILIMTAATASYANWLPQYKGGYPTPDVKRTVDEMTPQQLADEGETIIFGGIGQSKVLGAIGRGQCPLCHMFSPEYESDLTSRAPNLWGITARKRLKERSIEYIAESHVCPSCYVVGGYGVKGTEDRESPMPRIHKPPISLSIDDFIAVDTWLFWQEGEIPPPPDEIRTVYEALIPPDERAKGLRDENNPNRPVYLLTDGSESVDRIFAVAQCSACHIIPGIPGAFGTIGPKLTMKTQGPARIKDKLYTGKARTVREYITESILYPSVYVTSGYPDNTMPKVFGTKLSALAIDRMVDYLAEIEEGEIPPRIQ